MIVVTGSSGFIGRSVVDALVGAGEAVVAIDRRPGPAGWAADVAVVCSDLLRPSPPAVAALRRASVVIHLAGRGGVRDTDPGAPRRWWRDNVDATGVVLEHIGSDAHLVVASSSSVYGGSCAGRPSAETDRLRPAGGYARSKVAMERLVALRPGPTTVLRPFTVVGEGQRADMVLARWIDAAAAGRPLLVHGGRWRSRDVTDVRDVVRAVMAVVRRQVTGPLNVGTGRSVTLGELADVVRAVVADVEVCTVARPPSEPDHTLADPARLAGVVGVRPETRITSVVRRQARCQLGWGGPPGPVGCPRPPHAVSRSTVGGSLNVAG